MFYFYFPTILLNNPVRYTPFVPEGEMRLREAISLSWDHRACEWQLGIQPQVCLALHTGYGPHLQAVTILV